MSAAPVVLSVLLLVGVLGFAVARPRGLPEVLAAAPAALVVIAIGAVSLQRAWAEVSALLPVVAFLAAILALSHLCEVEGIFVVAGRLMARRAAGHPVRLLAVIFAVASVITAVLGLDATIVLLTPVVFLTAAHAGVRSKPGVYACTHLANSASLLLPTSNLTNLIALPATGLTFGGFALLMTLPWLVVIAIEFAVCRWYFDADLAVAGPALPAEAARMDPGTVALVAATLVGFVVAAMLGIPPAWAAAAGCLVLGWRALGRRLTDVPALVGAANLPFCAFVLALAVLVAAVAGPDVGADVARLLPQGGSFPALLGVALVGAVVANLLNNLPATLLLVPAASASGGAGAVLAVLLGVNLGPNLTYVGSLATLLWRRVLREHDAEPSLGEFSLLGAVSVPATIVGGTAALWLSLTVLPS